MLYITFYTNYRVYNKCLIYKYVKILYEESKKIIVYGKCGYIFLLGENIKLIDVQIKEHEIVVQIQSL